MKGPENTYGFIANTQGINANNEISYKTTIETYISALSIQTNKADANNVGNDAPVVPQINEPTNTNRTILKITNTNQIEPIRGKAYYDDTEGKIKIEVTYNTNEITKILDKNGKELPINSTTADTGNEPIGNKNYEFIIIDNKGNQKQVTVNVSGLDVYIIENKEDLKLFRNAVNAGNTKASTKAYQIADVKMNEGKYTIDEETGDITFAEDAEKWTGITNYYYGKYYGNNHTISGICGNKGLFDVCSGAEIRDLGIIESYIEASSSEIGTIVGSAQDNTIIENCYNEATIKVSNYYIGATTGGLVGRTAINSRYIQLTINKCYNNGKIIVDDWNGIDVGGLIGHCSCANILNCYNLGEIILQNKRASGYVGGIVGYGSEGLILNNCYNMGNITANEYVGGIVGYNYYDTINNCYNVGVINGNNRVGGITGSNTGAINNCYNISTITGNSEVGGITGYNYGYTRGSIKKSYNKGIIVGTSYVGGITGTVFRIYLIEDCSYEENTASYGIGNSSLTAGSDNGTTKLTQDQMPTVLSVINSDNAFVEDTDGINGDYPLLAWQVETTD